MAVNVLIEDTSFPLGSGSASESASGGEFGNIKLQNSSPKRKPRHSLIKGLDYESVAKLAPRKRNCVREFGPKRECLVHFRKT